MRLFVIHEKTESDVSIKIITMKGDKAVYYYVSQMLANPKISSSDALKNQLLKTQNAALAAVRRLKKEFSSTPIVLEDIANRKRQFTITAYESF